MDLLKEVLKAQKNEITEHKIYSWLSKKIKEGDNKKILKKISDDELKHYNYWKKITKKDVKANCFKVYWYIFLSTVFGLNFTLKFMEQGEKLAIEVYNRLKGRYKILDFIKDEHRHESQLLNLIKEEKIEYAGSIILGLNDALVELTGALAGLTFALQNAHIIAISGFIIGIAASLSMAASGYLSSKEREEKKPIKSAVYTGVAYVITVLLLISPYLILHNLYAALASTLTIAILIIAGYTFYITTAKNLKFWRRFLEMAIISLTVAAITFGMGVIARKWFGVEI
ncbi:VIT1/CCC1 transporter family protein [Candidatus Woesearchaeota archaeon]|nr:VIT1/CCC1 transporter family protein [Candidatus Woesearchaeota archaeon]